MAEVGAYMSSRDGRCRKCGNDTEQECARCGTPLCGASCAESSEHVDSCLILEENDVVGIALNQNEIKNVITANRELVLDGTSVYDQYSDKKLSSSTPGALDIAHLLSNRIRMFYAPAGKVFAPPPQAAKPTTLNRLRAGYNVGLEKLKHAAITKAEAFVFVDATGLYWPAIVIFGHRPKPLATGPPAAAELEWPRAYQDGIAYLGKRGVSGMLRKSAEDQFRALNNDQFIQWVRNSTRWVMPQRWSKVAISPTTQPMQAVVLQPAKETLLQQPPQAMGPIKYVASVATAPPPPPPPPRK